MDDLLRPALPTLARVTQIMAGRGIQFADLGAGIVGVGVGVPFGSDEFTVVSVAAGGNEGIVNMTIGVLKDITQNRLAALDECNKLTQNNAAYPYFLHDAPQGWDILLQVRMPLAVVVGAQEYFLALLRQLPAYANEGRLRIAAVAGGEPYQWNPEDCHRLLLRSML